MQYTCIVKKTRKRFLKRTKNAALTEEVKVKQCGRLCINMKEKCKLYFVFYDHKV